MNHSAEMSAARANHRIDVQWQIQDREQCPETSDIRRWAELTLDSDALLGGSPVPLAPVAGNDSELTVRIIDVAEMRSANGQWRGQDKPTNVLSFPSDIPVETGLTYYGDILVCADVLASESLEQGKEFAAHWAHIVIHGTLHLLGYDHIEAADAVVMERREIEILATLGINNPYVTVGETEVPPVGG